MWGTPYELISITKWIKSIIQKCRHTSQKKSRLIPYASLHVILIRKYILFLYNPPLHSTETNFAVFKGIRANWIIFVIQNQDYISYLST